MGNVQTLKPKLINDIEKEHGKSKILHIFKNKQDFEQNHQIVNDKACMIDYVKSNDILDEESSENVSASEDLFDSLSYYNNEEQVITYNSNSTLNDLDKKELQLSDK